MTRTMYDAIYAQNLPEGGQLYAGYVDGEWPDYNNIVSAFPNARHVPIATNPNTNNGIVGDGPPDNGTWPEWVSWVQMRRAAGVDPSINTNASTWPEARAAFQSAGVAEPHWWIANYDNDPTIPAGAVAKQYASNNSFDTSSVLDTWPGVDPVVTPPPPPPPPPPILEDEDMVLLSVSSTSSESGPPSAMRWLLTGNQIYALQDGQDVAGLEAAGVKTAEVSQRFIDHVAARLGIATSAL